MTLSPLARVTVLRSENGAYHSTVKLALEILPTVDPLAPTARKIPAIPLTVVAPLLVMVTPPL